MEENKEEFETIKINDGEDTNDYTFPSLDLSKFETQMKAFNSYSALDKFRSIHNTFEFDTKGDLTSGDLLDLKNKGVSKFSVDFSGKVTCEDPTADTHAATKGYVDSAGGGFDSDLEQRTSGEGSGDKTISHSLGRTPSLIIIKANLEGGVDDDSWSYGYIQSTGDRACTYYSQYNGGDYRTSDCIYLKESSSDYWEGDIKSMDEDEFVINFGKSGSPNACTFIWWAY